MTEENTIYEALAAHLDRLPAGFPRTSGGVEMRILRRLFNPEEAKLAHLLTVRPESIAAIAARASFDAADLGPKLESMAKKGLIFRYRKGDQAFYMAAQFVVGIWEYHVNDLDPDLIRDMNEYLPYFFDQSIKVKTPQLRTIPISKALPVEQKIMAYDKAREIVLGQEEIIVAPCICRKERQIVGEGCNRPLESCLVFGAGAQYYAENGLGRRIDHDEALRILDEAEKKGLVLQPSNAQKAVNICTCCGCCCQILKNLKRLPDPANHVASNYFAGVDQDLCTGCGVCLERCQMDAIEIDETAHIDSNRCIGCGLCVPTCPEEAVSLTAKSEGERRTPPAQFYETYKRIAIERMSRQQRPKMNPPREG
jgi:Na+-translocating ferredoxin:NAD+ oxidoreductase subunit B